MAFMTSPVSAGAPDDRMPVLAYNAKAGRLALRDRRRQADGEWATVNTDVTLEQPAFAVDFGRLEVGWVHFADGRAPQWAMAPYGQPAPAKPESPGIDARGRPVQFKAGFRVPVIGHAIGGVREFAGNSGALINAMNALHTAHEESPEARAGKIPLVKMTNVLEIRAGQSSNYQPVFAIQRWVDRPADRLGPPTVVPPAPSHVTRLPDRTPERPQARPPERTQAPITRAAAARIPTQIRYAPEDRLTPPVGRWEDEPPVHNAPAPAGGGWLDDEIPFAACWQ